MDNMNNLVNDGLFNLLILAIILITENFLNYFIFKVARDRISEMKFRSTKKLKSRKNPESKVRVVVDKNNLDGLDSPIKKSRIINLKKNKKVFY